MAKTDEERAVLRRQEQVHIDHRRHLISCEQKSQEEFDKTLVALSGGALAISFAFVENFIGDRGANQIWTLFGAWICWAAALSAVLISFAFSVRAIRTAVKEFDAGKDGQQLGGEYSFWLAVANGVAPALFATGLLLMFVFIYFNLER